MTSCFQLFRELSAPSGEDGVRFSVAALPENPRFRVGMDVSRRPALLIEAAPSKSSVGSPDELRHISYTPAVQCEIAGKGGVSSRLLSLVRCKSPDTSIQDVFLRVADSWLATLGKSPTAEQVAAAFSQLSELFEQLTLPSKGTVRGLWGELILLACSPDPERMCKAWHTDPGELYDFVEGREIVEVKTTGGTSRSHAFSLLQLSPPADSTLVVASVLALDKPPGDSLADLLSRVRSRLPARMGLRVELVVASTLGRDWEDSCRPRFSPAEALSTLAFFDWRDIPAVNRALPAEISNVRFTADLDAIEPLDLDELRSRGGLLAAAVPEPLPDPASGS